MPGVREMVDDAPWCIITLGADATTLRTRVRDEARALGVRYIDQAETTPQVERRASVAIRPIPPFSMSSLDPLVSALRTRGLNVSSGGEWLAVTDGTDKGQGVDALLTLLRAQGVMPSVVAAAGDGDNDVPLLQSVPNRFVIARDDGTWHADLQAISGVQRVTIPGIAGWCDVVRRVAALKEVG
jgi:predicted mannosyl-3-phosphoglycerate phosphatase (HAD superfamily)